MSVIIPQYIRILCMHTTTVSMVSQTIYLVKTCYFIWIESASCVQCDSNLQCKASYNIYESVTCVYLVCAEPSVTSSLQSLWGCERSLSHWIWGVAGLISPSSCSALHLLTCRMTPADLSLAQTPSITPPDAHPHSWCATEEKNLTNDSLVISLARDSEFRELIQDNKNDDDLSWSTTWQNHKMPIRDHNKFSTFNQCKRKALSALHSHSTLI